VVASFREIEKGVRLVTDIIDFLERLGQDAQLRHASESELRAALAAAAIEPAAATAILAGDRRTLERQLAARSEFCCLIYAPRREDEEEEEGDEEHEDDAPDQTGPKSRLVRQVA
jgi:hypothetical protein